MATQISWVAGLINTYTAFIQWGSAISTALAASGWVQTADTGQTVWSNISSMPGSGNLSNYQIWAMADSLQATSPVYMKLTFGQNSSSYPMLQVFLGNGTNGVGTLLNSTTVFNGSACGPNNATSYFPFYFSGATNRFALCIPYANTTAQNAPFVSIERIKSSAGADTSLGVTAYTANQQSASFLQTVILGLSNTTPSSFVRTGWISFGVTSSGTLSNRGFSAYPVMPLDANYNPYPAPLNTLVGRYGDQMYGLVFPMTVYGTSYPYLNLGMCVQTDGLGVNENILMRWN